MATKYSAQCHCAAVKYEVTLPAPLEETFVCTCNCSICTKNGYLLVYPDRNDVVWLRGEETLKEYRFGGKIRPHKFCPTCSSAILIDFRHVPDPARNKLFALNLRMFNDIDLTKVKLTPNDGFAKLDPPYVPE